MTTQDSKEQIITEILNLADEYAEDYLGANESYFIDGDADPKAKRKSLEERLGSVISRAHTAPVQTYNCPCGSGPELCPDVDGKLLCETNTAPARNETLEEKRIRQSFEEFVTELMGPLPQDFSLDQFGNYKSRVLAYMFIGYQSGRLYSGDE